MNIIHIGNFGRGWDNSICDEFHISNALNSLGYKTFNIQREAWNDLPNIEPNFILLAQWDGFTEDFIPMLRNYYTCPIVFWCYDYQADGQEWHERLIKQSDLYLSKRIADSKYPNWQWLSQDFSPEFLDKYPEPIERDIDVLFTGSYLPWATERNSILKAVDDKFNLVIHSVNSWDGFKDVRPPIMDEGLPELYARAKVILSIDHTIEAGYWSDRNAQIMCCGSVPLFKYVPLSEVRFGSTIAYFKDEEDCLHQIEHMLKWGEGEDDITRKVAYEYAQDYLKVSNRVYDLMTIVESIL